MELTVEQAIELEMRSTLSDVVLNEGDGEGKEGEGEEEKEVEKKGEEEEKEGESWSVGEKEKGDQKGVEDSLLNGDESGGKWKFDC